jgi:Mn-dependent DtxR family transcriptional regulator
MIHWQKSKSHKSLCGYYEKHKDTDHLFLVPNDSNKIKNIMHDPHFCPVCKEIYNGDAKEAEEIVLDKILDEIYDSYGGD